MRKVTFLTLICHISQPKRYTFYKSSTPIFLVKIHNSLTASVLQKPQNLALFCEEKIFCLENRPSRASCMVNLSDCNFSSIIFGLHYL